MERAVINRFIPFNPCCEISVTWDTKEPENFSRFLTTEEQQQFLKEAEVNWYEEIYYIMFLTGMRIGEVGALDWERDGGLGGVAKTCEELQREFDVEFEERELAGCYRTTQRIVDYYSNFQLKSMKIQAISDIKDEKGCLIYENNTTKSELFEKIAHIVRNEISKGVPDSEICIVAPQQKNYCMWFVREQKRTYIFFQNKVVLLKREIY